MKPLEGQEAFIGNSLAQPSDVIWDVSFRYPCFGYDPFPSVGRGYTTVHWRSQDFGLSRAAGGLGAL